MAGFGVADDGTERGYNADRALYELAAMLLVGYNTTDAVDAQGIDAFGERMERFKQLIENDRFKGVELQLSALRRHGHGGVVSNDIKGDLVHNLGNNGVDLSGHDGGAVLTGRQCNFAKAGSGAGGHKAQIVRNFGKVYSAGLQRAGERGIYVQVLRAVDQVSGFHQHFIGELGDKRHDVFNISSACVYAGADCRSAKVQLANLVRRLTDSSNIAANRYGIRLKFLP